MQVLDLNGIPTHVFHLKHRAEGPEGSATAKPSSLALVIPGSPGMGHFYAPFATRLFQLGGGSYDVAVVSHAGHSPGHIRPPPNHSPGNLAAAQVTTNGDIRDSSDHEDSGHRDWYNLEEQISHKMAFLEEYAPNADTVYLIGHSIGSWMVLQLLKRLAPSRVTKAFLLFPTIERMRETPKGTWMTPLFTTWRHPFTFFVWGLSWIPDFLKRFVLRRHFYTTPADQVEHMVQGAINIDSRAIYNILCMADEEMKTVTDLPHDVITSNIEKLVFYYGVADKWNLEDCHSNMRERYPDKEVHLCEKGHAHAFVETASNDMAEFVFSKIKS